MAIENPCPACGALLGLSTRFCINCGSAVGGVATSAAATVVAFSGPLASAAPTQSTAPLTAAPRTEGWDPFACAGCGGDGARLSPQQTYCAVCRWLRPLGPGYDLPVHAFMWSFDADAMSVLGAIGPLSAAAHALSERVGRPWFEASVNGLRLSEKQLPEIFEAAIKAARIVGLPYLPEIYISGEHMWDAVTIGSNSSAFIAFGSVLTMFRGDDLLYLLGREMGHAKAGHALWRTVVNLMAGAQPGNRSLMSQGVLSFLNPAKLIESGINAPLMAWQRQAEITADRAGLLVVGDMDVVRRVTLQATLHSFPLQQRINMDAWIEQEDESDAATQAAEMVMTSMPYAARRLRLLREFSESPDLLGWRRVIEYWLPPKTPDRAGDRAVPAAANPAEVSAPPPDTERLVCMACKAPMRVPKSILQGPGPINIRCPNGACGRVLSITPKPRAPTAARTSPAEPAPPPPAPASAAPAPADDAVRLVCAICRSPMRVPRPALLTGKPVHVRCPSAACGKVLTITPRPVTPASLPMTEDGTP